MLLEEDRCLVFNRILSCCHHERFFQFACDTVGRYLMFTHCFKQGTLDFWRCPVNLVYQYDMVEQRSGFEPELPALLLKHIRARDIRRQQIRRRLNAYETDIQQLCETIDGTGLGDPGGPSIRRCPPVSKATSSRSTRVSRPTN